MSFTSGSTGKPKGVILSAYNILNAANVNYVDQTLRPDDRTCMILPFFHIFGLVAGIFANALADSTIFIPPNIRTSTLLNLIFRERCTIFHSVPTMLIALINNKNFSADKLSTLRCTIISGAAATDSQIKMFREKMPNNHFLSSYGLSEMAPVSITNYNDTDYH
ncbi:MAG: acyl--CoA ligase [Selenomonadaceae bacterium]|nr:acyl--CoA ligase [Selenomonadaceae bacterium]